jgi:hypothetical protein
MASKTTHKELFSEPRFQFLLDAMIIAEFARQLDGAQNVRLATEADEFPDGFVETSEGTLSVEVTKRVVRNLAGFCGLTCG